MNRLHWYAEQSTAEAEQTDPLFHETRTTPRRRGVTASHVLKGFFRTGMPSFQIKLEKCETAHKVIRQCRYVAPMSKYRA